MSPGRKPKGPGTPIVYTLALKYPYFEYSRAKVHTIWVNGPLGDLSRVPYHGFPVVPLKRRFVGAQVNPER